MWKKKAEIWRAINQAWYVFYSNLWGTAEACNSAARLLLDKRVTQLICITTHHLACFFVFFFPHHFHVLRCCYLIHINRVTVVPWPCDSGKACFTPDLCHYPATTSRGRQSRDQGRPGEILSPDVKKKKKRKIGCTKWSLSPHCQEFNFTQPTSARDKWNINNVIHGRGETHTHTHTHTSETHPLITTMTFLPNVLLFCYYMCLKKKIKSNK